VQEEKGQKTEPWGWMKKRLKILAETIKASQRALWQD
jgi:hypothetical protein